MADNYLGTVTAAVAVTSAVTLLAGTARTAEATSPAQTSSGPRGAILYLNISAGSTIVQLIVEAQDPVSGTWIAVTNFDALGGPALAAYVLYPGGNLGSYTVPNLFVSGIPLPRTWRVRVAHSDAVAVTYSVAAHLLP